MYIINIWFLYQIVDEKVIFSKSVLSFCWNLATPPKLHMSEYGLEWTSSLDIFDFWKCLHFDF